jgi:PleD family two-component response regulator
MHSKKLSVTISVGATLAREHDTPVSLIKRADNLLSQNKVAGRNCVTAG